MWTRWRLWLASVLRRREFDRDIDAELTFHLQARADHLLREGVPATDAQRQARLEIGGLKKYKDELRDTRRGAWVEQLGQDLRYGARVLLRRPGFTVAAIVTLALGVGATATVFSLLDVVLLRSLPVRDPHELAHIYTSCRAGDVYCACAYPEYLDYRSQSRTFVDMAAFHRWKSVSAAIREAGSARACSFRRTISRCLVLPRLPVSSSRLRGTSRPIHPSSSRMMRGSPTSVEIHPSSDEVCA